MKVDIIELMKRAYVAGFRDSRSGCNGERPFNYDTNRIRGAVGPWANHKIREILKTADSDDP